MVPKNFKYYLLDNNKASREKNCVPDRQEEKNVPVVPFATPHRDLKGRGHTGEM